MASSKIEVVVVKEDFYADHDIWVDEKYTKEVDAGSPEAFIVLAYRGQYVEHDSAVRLGLVKATKEEKTTITTGGTSGPGSGSK